MQKNRVTFLCSSNKGGLAISPDITDKTEQSFVHSQNFGTCQSIRPANPHRDPDAAKSQGCSSRCSTGSDGQIHCTTSKFGTMVPFSSVHAQLSHKQQRVGTLPKEEHTGKTIADYKTALAAAGHSHESVDISVALGAVMAIKDDEELVSRSRTDLTLSLTRSTQKIIRTTSNLCNTLVASYILPKIELIIDKEKPTSHAGLVSLIEHRLGDVERPADTKLWSKGRGLADVRYMNIPDDFDANNFPLKVDFSSVEFVYVPQIQSSASGYTLKLLNEPSPANISFKGVLMTSVGLKYKGYCANISRTYIVDPTPTQEEVYALVVEIHKEVVPRLKEGAVAKDIYAHALSIVKQKKPALEAHFVKSLGHAVCYVSINNAA
jgi:nucleosome binding factor SPN SPT16 subunit